MRAYERNGVTVDQCTECRGIFLDRGELERLTEAENAWHGSAQQPHQPAPPPPPQPGYQQHGYPQQQPGYQQPGYSYGGHPHHKKKKHSFFEELFD
jgi:Zn-finger nucleic acid-binding protein